VCIPCYYYGQVWLCRFSVIHDTLSPGRKNNQILQDTLMKYYEGKPGQANFDIPADFQSMG
jgi:hypothetical protein